MRLLEGHTAAVYSLSFSPDGMRLASAGKDGSIRVWYLGVNRPPTILGPIGDFEFVTAEFDPAEQWLAGGSSNGRVFLWDARYRKLELFAESDVAVTSLAFCNRGKHLAVGFGDRINAATPGLMNLIDLDKKHLVQSFGQTNGVWEVAADPNGKRIYWGGGDKRVTRWDMTSPDQKFSPRHSREVRSLAVSPDGKSIAVGDDYSVRRYDANTMMEIGQLTGHRGRVDGLAFSADGAVLASGAWDKQVKLWDVESGREISSHDWGVANVRALAFSPDGLTAAAAGDRGVIALWDLDF